jgi:cellulase/cellobiase CelA1
MPPIKSEPGGFKHLFWVIPSGENLDGSALTHTEGRKGNLLVRTQIRSLRISGPLDGAPDEPVAGQSFHHSL